MVNTANTVTSSVGSTGFNPVVTTDSNGIDVTPSSSADGLYWVYSFTNTSLQYTMTFKSISTSGPPPILSCLAVGGGGRGLNGGGGAGGMVETTLTVSSSQSITIVVGAGDNNYNGGVKTTITTTRS